jgi:quercetin dioxygenase-like cupin family protein
VGEKEYYLKTGDSIYFDATLPHAQIAMEKEARFLTVIQK